MSPSPTLRDWLLRRAAPLLCVGIVAWMAVPRESGPSFQRFPTAGGRMPAWTMKDLQGRAVSSETYAGKVVLLNFWATWCPPCLREIPDLQQFHADHAAEGFTVIGASVESDTPEVVRDFVSRRKLTYPVLLADPSIQMLFGGVSANPMSPGGLPLPTTFVVARDGRYVARYLGALTREELDRVLLPLLRNTGTNAVGPRGS